MVGYSLSVQFCIFDLRMTSHQQDTVYLLYISPTSFCRQGRERWSQTLSEFLPSWCMMSSCPDLWPFMVQIHPVTQHSAVLSLDSQPAFPVKAPLASFAHIVPKLNTVSDLSRCSSVCTRFIYPLEWRGWNFCLFVFYFSDLLNRDF